MSAAMRKKQSRRPQNPWPKIWQVPKDYNSGIMQDFSTYKKEMNVNVIDHKKFQKFCTLGIKYITTMSLIGIRAPVQIIKRIKFVRKLSLQGKIDIKHPIRVLKRIIFSDFNDLNRHRLLSWRYLFQSKRLQEVYFQNVPTQSLNKGLKELKMARLNILHISIKNTNLDLHSLERLKDISEIRQLRFELKRITAEKTKVAKIFEELSQLKRIPKIFFDLYNLEILHEKEWLFNAYLEKLHASNSSFDFRIAQSLPAQYDFNWIKDLEYLAVNLQSSVKKGNIFPHLI
jgi:hypothetical protein